MISQQGWASDPVTPPGGAPWDLLVVGGGTAGLVAAHTAAGLGAAALLVEQERTGGDCLWTGCVPSKSLLAAAHAAAGARGAGSLGVRTGRVEVDFPAVMAHVRRAIATIEPVDSPDAVRRAGASVAHGTAVFTGPTSAVVDGEPVAFRQALVATGSDPLVPDVPGLRRLAPLTSETVWELEALPERLVVLGGGPVGCELGQAFARLGSRVTLVEAAPRLLAHESAAAAAAVAEALAADGVDVRCSVSATRAEQASAGTLLHLDDDTTVTAEEVVVAVGRRPRTDGLGLERAGVDLDDAGHVAVDARLSTSNPRVWAAGDVTGHPAFTHVAGVHGSQAASNAVLGLRRRVDPALVPRVTYTRPEVAAFGVSPDDADRRGLTVRETDHRDVDRAVAEDETGGHTTLVLDRRGRVVGASVVGPRAGETLAEAVLAARAGVRARTLAGVMHPYPAWSDGVWKAALAQGRADLESGPVRGLTRALAAGRRRWLDARSR